MKYPSYFAVLLTAFISGCTTTDASVKSTMHGSASFYTDTYTASGERYNKNAHTAAHRTLPFGTKVRVTNKRNGESTIVRINDRGPAKWTKRDIDLSHGAASAIGMLKAGVVPVQMEVLSKQ